MNTDLLNKNLASLTAHIEEWVSKNPGILAPDEQLVVCVSATKRPSMVTVTIGDRTPGALEDILGQGVHVLEPLLGNIYGCKNAALFSNLNITTIRDLVKHTVQELLKQRNYGGKSLNALVSALNKLDTRLKLGMKLPPPPSS